MRHAWFALALCALVATACTKQEKPDDSIDTAPEPLVEEEPDGSRATPFDAARTYGGRISVPPPPEVTSFVVRDDASYDALLARIPKTNIQKKQPADPNNDPLLTRPAIDFTGEMLVVAVCGTFYCPITLKEFRIEGDTLIVTYEAPGEDEDTAAMAVRPISMNGADAYGNYAAGIAPAHDGEVTFENASRPK